MRTIILIYDIIVRYWYLATFSFICLIVCIADINLSYSIDNLGSADIYLYIFSHANIFHMGINLYALWRFKPRLLTFIVGLIVAMVVPYVSALSIPTCGASAMIVAMMARHYVAWKKTYTRIIIYNAILLAIMLIPGISVIFNVLAHIMAFCIGFIFWTTYYKIKILWKKEN